MLCDLMRILVTGSAGHLGEALVRTLRADGQDVIGLDVLDSETTEVVGAVGHPAGLGSASRHVGAEAVVHAATLHKPHVGSHGPQEFVDTNVTGTLNLL